jgi:hypothetical protein
MKGMCANAFSVSANVKVLTSTSSMRKHGDRNKRTVPDKGLEINEHTEGWLSVVFLILIVSLHTPIHKSLPDETD